MFPKTPPRYVLAALAISLGGLINGYDTGSIGAVLSMAQFTDAIGKLSSSLVGFTVSLIMLAGAVPSVFAGWLADRYGRLRTIMLGTVLFALGAVLQGTATRLPQFLAGRTLAGLGEGVYLSSMAVYISEISPTRSRGVLAGLPQFMATLGICLGYFTCYASVHIGADRPDGASPVSDSMAWRLPFIVMIAIAGVLVFCCARLPESPRWLISYGDRVGAMDALRRLDFSMAEAEKEFLSETSGVAGGPRPSLSPWQSFTLLFKRGYRARTILALFVLGMVQLSGIDGVLYYAPLLFGQAGLSSSTASFLASGLSGILMLAISIPAFLLSDKWGRRTSAITGGLGLSACMFLIGSLYAAGAVHSYGIARWVVIVCVFLFGLVYSATWGIVGKVYASEIQPTHVRAAANCVAQGLGFFTNWLVAILTPVLLDKSAFGAYFLFGGLALFTVAVLGACMPETRGRSLEDIQQAFHQPCSLGSLTSKMKTLGVRHRNGHGNASVVALDQTQTVVDEVAEGGGNAVELSNFTNPVLREPVIRPLRVTH
ncbi:general substrate transporter [Coniella lustricola]|uniref:General substrate transporter n=1 Tax=Coniella lustricola TaxID=2025994 RepID=A0A2T3AB28_9PEZI|nr:general substrate transporter [Coniella lustricola]